ncbi:hypothetical protein PYCC9005_001380 [Savitreella phatthalungensis]
MLWSRHRRRAGQKASRDHELECFYCGARATLRVTGRVEDWRCASCEALNILDDDGRQCDFVPVKYQHNSSSGQARNDLAHPSLSSPFCSVCISNHALLTKTLASYLPDEDDPDYHVYEQALPAYRTALEERYPPVCTACTPGVRARLERNNYVAKSSALGQWLSRAKAVQMKGSTGLSQSLRKAAWAVRGLLWFGGAILFTLIVLSDMASRRKVPSVLYIRPGRLQRLLFVTIFGAFWSPQSRTLIRRPDTHLSGKGDHIRLQILAQTVRFCRIYVIPRLAILPNVADQIDVLALVFTIVQLVISLRLVRIQDQAQQITLHDRSAELIASIVPAEERPETLEADDSHHNLSPFEPRDHRPRAMLDNAAAPVAEADAMDWQPSPKQDTTQIAALPAGMQASPFSLFGNSTKSDAIHHSAAVRPLAPQRLYPPEKPTGLESLFSAAVRLDDEPLLVRSLKQVNGGSWEVSLTHVSLTIVLLGLLAGLKFCDLNPREFLIACALGGVLHALTLDRLERKLIKSKSMGIAVALLLWAGFAAAKSSRAWLESHHLLLAGDPIAAMIAVLVVLAVTNGIRCVQPRRRHQRGQSPRKGNPTSTAAGRWQQAGIHDRMGSPLSSRARG